MKTESADQRESAIRTGMSATQARWLERLIIALSVLSILFIFQPFSLPLFTVGCVLVVVFALAFNLVPFCRAGTTARQLMRVVMIILIILVIAALLGIGTAFLYVEYLENLR